MTDQETHDTASDSEPTPTLGQRLTRRRELLIGLGGGLLLGAGGGYYAGLRMARRGSPRGPRRPTPPAMVPLAAHRPRKGPEPAKVVLVAFTDFQ